MPSLNGEAILHITDLRFENVVDSTNHLCLSPSSEISLMDSYSAELVKTDDLTTFMQVISH